MQRQGIQQLLIDIALEQYSRPLISTDSLVNQEDQR